MRGWIDRLLLVHDEETAPVLWSFFYFFFLLASYFCLRPLREAIAVATGVSRLPYLFLTTFLIMLALMPAFGWLVARFPKRVFLPVSYAFFLLNLMVFQQLLGGDPAPSWAAWAYFSWLSVFNLFVVSVFWSLMADLFNSQQGKRLFGVIAAGGSLGAIIGPLITAALIDSVGRGGILLVAAVLLSLALGCQLVLIGRLPATAGSGRPAVIGGSIVAGATRVFADPFLRGIAWILLLTTLLQSVMYYQQTELVGRFYGERDPTRFFATVDAATNVLSVILQFLITGRLLQRIGVARVLAVVPVVTALGFVALALAPGAMVVGVVQTLRRAGEYGMMKPARDLLYTRVDDESRYKAKNFIDTVVYRGGDVASGWSYKGLSSGLRLPMEAIAALAVPLALLWGWLAHGLGRRFEERPET